MSLAKIVFDHTLITSQFLNDLQDAVIALEDDAAESATVSSSGLVTFKNSKNQTAFTLQLPDVTVETTVSGTAPTITPQDKHIYKCGTLTSLTVSSAPATGAYEIIFTSGSTATIISGLSGIKGLENFNPVNNKTYEINVYDNRAVVGEWSASASVEEENTI